MDASSSAWHGVCGISATNRAEYVVALHKAPGMFIRILNLFLAIIIILVTVIISISRIKL